MFSGNLLGSKRNDQKKISKENKIVKYGKWRQENLKVNRMKPS